MEVDIRDAVEDDAAAIATIWNQIIETGRYSALDTPLTAEAQREFLADFSERGIFIVAEARQDHGLVGFQTLEPFASYTHAFDHVAVIGTCVDLSFHRRGVGRQLSQFGLARAKEIGYEKLFTYVRADNHGALSFYRGLGFRVVGTAKRHGKYGGRYVDSVFLERFLSGRNGEAEGRPRG